MSELRGFPLVGRGMTGAISGTDPVRALLAKEAREERQRARQRHYAALAASRKLKERKTR